jgi:hypothetical protein
VEISRNDLGQKGSLAPCDIDGSRVDSGAQGVEDARPMRADEASPTPVVVSGQHDGRDSRPQCGDDARVQFEKERDGIAGSVRARVEDVSRDEERGFRSARRVLLAAERFHQDVEERTLAALRRVDVEVGKVEKERHPPRRSQG